MKWKFENPKRSGKYWCILRQDDKNVMCLRDFFVDKKEADSGFNSEPGWLYGDKGWNSFYWFPIEADYECRSLAYTSKQLHYKSFVLCWLDMQFPNGIEVDSNALF